ncbi:MAG: hypothetical protein WC867_08475 [Candidatus Pacearchaeota archaeon]|jgi:ADP-ribose pyrophosphatase YjhB (NUDIX family)
MENNFEKKILELFLFNKNLKFNEIEKQIKIRSNKLSYHIKNLIKKNILLKNDDEYSLSKTAEYLIPYLSNKKAILPVLLIHIGDKNNCFLYERKKRPYKDYLSLPGGRLMLGESIEESSKRIAKEKYNINITKIKINSISLEHIKKSNNKINSFLLIFISAKTKDKLSLTPILKNKSKIIPSDYLLLNNDLDKEIRIKTLNSRLKE